MAKITLTVLLFITGLLCWHCNSLMYGIEQGYGQIKVICKAEPIEKLLADPDFPDSLKSKLFLIQEIRQYAIDSLGLNDSESYNTVFDQQGKPILWVVTASPPYEIKEYHWSFPIAGDFPYKGYFNKKNAEKEAQKLREKGYDTEISIVEAWSTLGFFNDPILSNMLSRSEGRLARVIIHELTHSTVFVKNDIDFNENLATFVGDYGAKKFLGDKYGVFSPQYREYIGEISDMEKYSEHILRGANKLDSLYQTFDEQMDEEQKVQKKNEMIRQIMATTDTINFYDKSIIDRISEDNYMPNNAYFVHFRMYRENLIQFESEFKNEYKSDFRTYLYHLKQKYQ